MTDFFIERNDTSPLFQVTFLDADGNAAQYTGASSVRFHMLDSSGATVVDSDMTQTTPASGVATYEWAAGDTETSGFYNAECEVTYSDGKVQTFPNYGYFRIHITDDLL